MLLWVTVLQIRGDPDGCGLDISGIRYSPTSELRVDLPAEDLLNIKKGWLMKQGLNKVRADSFSSLLNACPVHYTIIGPSFDKLTRNETLSLERK